MGKGEELHMELEFDRDVIHCWEIAADGTLCQEETLETIVPDACPDTSASWRCADRRH